MTETYTITEQPLQTSWQIWKYRGDTKLRVSSSTDWNQYDNFSVVNADTYKNFDIEKLTAAGYTKFSIKLDLWTKDIYRGDKQVRMVAGWGGNGTVLYTSAYWDPNSTSYWANRVENFTISLNAIQQGQFSIGYDASGSLEDDYEVDNVSVLITAQK